MSKSLSEILGDFDRESQGRVIISIEVKQLLTKDVSKAGAEPQTVFSLTTGDARKLDQLLPMHGVPNHTACTAVFDNDYEYCVESFQGEWSTRRIVKLVRQVGHV